MYQSGALVCEKCHVMLQQESTLTYILHICAQTTSTHPMSQCIESQQCIFSRINVIVIWMMRWSSQKSKKQYRDHLVEQITKIPPESSEHKTEHEFVDTGQWHYKKIKSLMCFDNATSPSIRVQVIISTVIFVGAQMYFSHFWSHFKRAKLWCCGGTCPSHTCVL